MDSLFEFVDTWTLSVKAEDYVEFMRPFLRSLGRNGQLKRRHVRSKEERTNHLTSRGVALTSLMKVKRNMKRKVRKAKEKVSKRPFAKFRAKETALLQMQDVLPSLPLTSRKERKGGSDATAEKKRLQQLQQLSKSLVRKQTSLPSLKTTVGKQEEGKVGGNGTESGLLRNVITPLPSLNHYHSFLILVHLKIICKLTTGTGDELSTA